MKKLLLFLFIAILASNSFAQYYPRPDAINFNTVGWPSFNVRAFGAVGDSTKVWAANATAFQRCADWIDSVGYGIMYIPGGDYHVRQFEVGDSTVVVGDGPGLTNIFCDSIWTAKPRGVITNKDWTNGNSYITVKELKVHKYNSKRINSPGGAFNDCIFFQNGEHVTVENVHVENLEMGAITGNGGALYGIELASDGIGDKGITLEGVKYPKMRNLVAINIQDNSFRMGGTASTDTLHGIMENCIAIMDTGWSHSAIIVTGRFLDVDKCGFDVGVADGSTPLFEMGSGGIGHINVSRCWTSNASFGGLTWGGSFIGFTNNHTDTSQTGVTVLAQTAAPTRHIKIIGNTGGTINVLAGGAVDNVLSEVVVSGNTSTGGISIANAAGFTVADNIISGGKAGVGLSVTTCDSGKVHDNTIYGVSSYGCVFQSFAHGEVVNNTVWGSGDDGFYLFSCDTLLMRRNRAFAFTGYGYYFRRVQGLDLIWNEGTIFNHAERVTWRGPKPFDKVKMEYNATPEAAIWGAPGSWVIDTTNVVFYFKANTGQDSTVGWVSFLTDRNDTADTLTVDIAVLDSAEIDTASINYIDTTTVGHAELDSTKINDGLILAQHSANADCDTVASASTITLGMFNNFLITGTTNLDSINTASTLENWAIIVLEFNGILTVNDAKNLYLDGNCVTADDETLTLQRRGNYFYELARSDH